MLLPVMFTDHTIIQFSFLLVVKYQYVMAISGFANSADIAGSALRL